MQERAYCNDSPPPYHDYLVEPRERGVIYNAIILLQRCSYGVAAGKDSADILPVEDNVGEARNTRPFGSD